ncbi:hypothetical protein LGE98_001432 [Salmonella enterica]|nr:hypothetical protein [Salmonella enterica]EIG9275227.1 hypothetical protein [Salmonella enterica]EIM8804167.1 hypothetical protein [Salmonella enterica]EJL5775378.1 hypothetical protein [Salmonella enterica]EKB9852009.1 hypothetical protein [Salmonella enterica]
MATYKQIQEYVKINYGVSVKTCHIAHVKYLNGFQMKLAPNRISADSRVYECPDKYVLYIEQAMKHFGIFHHAFSRQHHFHKTKPAVAS